MDLNENRIKSNRSLSYLYDVDEMQSYLLLHLLPLKEDLESHNHRD